MSSLPLQRSIQKAEEEGYLGDIVERFIPFPKPWGHRRDFLKLFDWVGIKGPPLEVLGIQACTDSAVSDHFKKLTENPDLSRFKATGAKGVIWGWSFKVKRNPDGSRTQLKDGTIDPRKVWTVREVVL